MSLPQGKPLGFTAEGLIFYQPPGQSMSALGHSATSLWRSRMSALGAVPDNLGRCVRRRWLPFTTPRWSCGVLRLAHPLPWARTNSSPSRDLHPAVGAGPAGSRWPNRRSLRVSGSLTPVKQAIWISSRRSMASRPSSLSKSSGERLL